MSAPKFTLKSELARYVSEFARNGNRTSPVTFYPDAPSDHPRLDYLSVNSLEIESMQAIAKYYRAAFQSDAGDVAMTSHKVFFYSETARKCGIDVRYDKENSRYEFEESNGSYSVAYAHHARTDALKSPSHSGVHLVRGLKKQHQVAQFARRMSAQKCHVFKE